MNDAERLYQTIQRRLLEDGLLRSAVSRVRASAAEIREERDFQFWQVETCFPAAVNRLIDEIGEK